MYASLRALLTGLIDYAGLFPPAGLPLDEAVRNYARYRATPEAWMLGRFVCPAARLKELDRYVRALFAEGPPLVLAVLASTADTLDALLTCLRADVKLLAAFQARHGDRVAAETLEIRLPAYSAQAPQEALTEALMAAADILESGTRAVVTPYYEAPAGPRWPQVLSAMALASLTRAAAKNAFGQPAGFKLRCGGQESAPAPEIVAQVIRQCRDRGIALKATAGLHHPLRRLHLPDREPMHGFINVFGAAVLAHGRQLSEEQLRPILEDEDAHQFVFDDEGFHWHDFHATTAEITTAREQFATSFGSCSFDEPRADLRALGWL